MEQPVAGPSLTQISSRLLGFLARPGRHLIGGKWTAPSSGECLLTLNPATGERIAEIAKGTAHDVDAAVRDAAATFCSAGWRNMGPFEREALLHRLADLLEDVADDLAVLETLDNGMPIWMARDMNVAGAIDVIRYMAGWPTKLHGRTVQVEGPGDGRYSGFTSLVPRGVVGAIVPWNVPLMMAVWKIAPALAAGCTVVLKPAEAASLSALFLGEVVLAAGFPPGALNVVTGLGPEVGEPLVCHSGVAKITFTGSTATGSRVGALCGGLGKPASLELGGKSPTVIFPDAPLDKAISGAAQSIFLNSGQICVAGSRLYVHRDVFDEVVEGLVRHAEGLKMGDGLSPDTTLGPLISGAQQIRVTDHIRRAVEGGATVLTPQAIPARGFFVAPTVIVGVAHDAPLTQEEIFGPVLSVYAFTHEDEVVEAANGTPYGLAASIWTSDISRVLRMVDRLECGKFSINTSVFPYPGLPEGGCKASGYGRDLGAESLEAYLHIKSVIIELV
jgi:phenylacetaldehyde dehydrogenase